MASHLQLMEQMQAHRVRLSDMRIAHWIQYEVFSFQWWIMLMVTIGCWLVWWRLFPRQRAMELLLYGGIISAFATELDSVGVDLSWWTYKVDLAPVFDRLFAVDMAVLPVTFLLIYQSFPRWIPFLTAHVVVAFAFAFIAEPIASKMGIYVPLQWKNYYSVPLYIAVPVFTRWLVEQIKWMQQRGQAR